MRTGSRVPARAVVRQAWTDRGLLALGLVVLVGVTTLVTVTPRGLDAAATREVRAAVADPDSGASLSVLAPLDESQDRQLRTDTGQEVASAMAAVIGTLPAEVSAALGDPVGSLVSSQLKAGDLHGTPLLLRGVLLVDASRDEGSSDERSWHLTDASAASSGAVEWVSGTPPQGRAPADGLLRTGGGYELVDPTAPRGTFGPPTDVWIDPSATPEPIPEGEPMPVQVGLSEEVAALLGVRAGGTIAAQAPDGGAVRVTVTGVFRALDPDAPRWRVVPTVLTPREVGGSAARVEAGMLLGAGSAADLRLAMPIGRMSRTVTLEARPEALDAGSADAVARGTARIAAAPTAFGLVPAPLVTTRLDTAIDDALGRARAASAQAGIVLTGVVAAALLALALAVSVVLRRRAAVLALQRGRGAGLVTVAAAQAVEHVPLVALGGVLGVVLADRLEPGPVPWAWVASPLVAAALGGPALAVAHAWRAGAPPPAHVERHRTAAALRRPLAEGTLVALAAAALLSVRGRGVTSSVGAADLPLLAAPVLAAAVVGVLLARVLPPLARLVRHATAHGRGAVGLLAGARVAPRVLPLSALVLASAVLALALGVQATVREGTVDGSWQAVGGDVALRAGVDGWVPEEVAALGGTAGVEAAAVARVVDGIQVLGSGVDEVVRVVAVDPESFAALLAALPGGSGPQGLAALAAAPVPTGPDQPVPALVAGLPTDAASMAMRWQGESIALDPVGAAPALPAVPQAPGWRARSGGTVLVARDALAAATGAPVEASVGWAVGPGAAQAVRALDLGDVAVTTRADWLTATREAPAAAAFALLLRVSGWLLLALAALTVLLDAAGSAPARAAAAARLRVLGLPRGRTTLTALAEVSAPALVAAAAGVLTGAGLLVALVQPLGLASLTGQTSTPAWVLPWSVVWPVPAVAVAAVLAVALAARRRERLGQVLRAG